MWSKARLTWPMRTLPRLYAVQSWRCAAVSRAGKARQDHLRAAMPDRLEPPNSRCYCKVGPLLRHVKKHFALRSRWNCLCSLKAFGCMVPAYFRCEHVLGVKENKAAFCLGCWRGAALFGAGPLVRGAFHISALEGSLHILAE